MRHRKLLLVRCSHKTKKNNSITCKQFYLNNYVTLLSQSLWSFYPLLVTVDTDNWTPLSSSSSGDVGTSWISANKGGMLGKWRQFSRYHSSCAKCAAERRRRRGRNERTVESRAGSWGWLRPSWRSMALSRRWRTSSTVGMSVSPTRSNTSNKSHFVQHTIASWTMHITLSTQI